MWSKLLAAVGMKHGHNELMTQGDYDFMQYVSEYGKSYGTKAEFEFRGDIFKQNLQIIAEHNADETQGHKLGINHTADWTHEEYKRLLGYKPELRQASNEEPVMLDTSNLADEVNWVTKGAVTPVKDQKQCGSCWAFSTTGSVEGAYQISKGDLKSFSEQNLVDCSKQNHACQGGLMDYAFAFIKDDHPLMLESDYPYTGHHNLFSKCKYEQSKGVGGIKGFSDVKTDNADQLRAAVANAPVSIAVEADKSAFQLYKSGVITSAACGKKLDHGVLAVGYGTENGKPYFLVKNSWGPGWGDKGYLKIAGTSANVCGILSQPSFPTE